MRKADIEAFSKSIPPEVLEAGKRRLIEQQNLVKTKPEPFTIPAEVVEAGMRRLRENERILERRKRFRAAKGNKTRSSFGWASANRMTGKLVGSDLSASANYQPPGPCLPLLELLPAMGYKDITEYWVIKYEGKKAVDLLHTGFKRCCNADKHCEKDNCAKCWALKQQIPKKYHLVVREVVNKRGGKVVDSFGVDPKGKRSPGKDMDPDVRASYRLTSTVHAYKRGAAGWREE